MSIASKEKYWINEARLERFRIFAKQNPDWYEKLLPEKNPHKEKINTMIGRILRSRLKQSIKQNSKTGSAVRDLGCTIPELKQHLEKQFTEGMNWDNHGLHGWHIDHIKMLHTFDLTNQEQFLKACHYTNLRPLWAKDNLSRKFN